MTLRWEDFPEELKEIGGYIFEVCASHNIRFGEASEIFTEFIQRPKKHIFFEDDWIEFMEEKKSKAQEGALTESVTTQIEPDSKGDTGKDSEVEKVVEWDKDEQLLILETIIEEGAEYNTPIELACELFKEFIQRPRRHESFLDNWVEFNEEKEFEAQGGMSTESVATQNELESIGDESRDSEVNEVPSETSRSKETETPEEKLEAGSRKEEQPRKKPQQQWDDPRSLPIPCSIGEVNFKEAPCDIDSNINSMSLYHVDRLKEAHDEQEDQEKQLVEIETDQRNASSVRDEDFYKGAEPQPMKSQEQDLQQKEQPSNKAEEKAEIDKVIDMICALFATIKLKRVWKQYLLFLKFLGFLTKKRKKADDIFHLSYKTP
ncbi:hypothetical protein QL285_070318 [Trifolium repens]|nr:hypothetical protein QL285_070318 [Trifolium repens]